MQMRRLTTDEMMALDVRVFARNGVISRGDRVFQERGQGGRLVQAISLDWTRCHYGGERPWFLCPDCSRRAAILYAGPHYACRRCHGLYYECQRTRGRWSAVVRLQRLRERLGGSGNLTEPFPQRPRYMHRRTYERLQRRERDLEVAYVAAMKRRFPGILRPHTYHVTTS